MDSAGLPDSYTFVIDSARNAISTAVAKNVYEDMSIDVLIRKHLLEHRTGTRLYGKAAF